MTSEGPKIPAWKRITREHIVFVTGIAGIVHETVVADVERPMLFFGFLAMAGLTPFLPERK